MAGFDYGRMQGTATRLLDRFNQGVVVLTKPGTSTPGPEPYDPPVYGEPTEYPLNATVKGVSKEFIDGTTIVATDLEITAAVFGAEPDLTDTVTIDGEAVTVIKAWAVPPAGVTVAWKFIVRG